MLQITLNNLAPFDGTYDLDFAQPFTLRELHWIKEISGVRAGEIKEISPKGDSDLLIAFTFIAVHRKGRVRKEQVGQFTELLLDAPEDAIEADYTPEEDDAGPPEPSETPTPSTNGSNENTQSSSVASNGTGDTPLVSDPAFTGHPV